VPASFGQRYDKILLCNAAFIKFSSRTESTHTDIQRTGLIQASKTNINDRTWFNLESSEFLSSSGLNATVKE
jgi:hypothetical protein